tara:strand:- start:21 stop:641 length:621 start_codon:yes stop_codon:yes gene_type:complete
MKKVIITILLSIICYPAIGQTTATIDENGKKVILKNNGTWEYKSEVNKDFKGDGIWYINYFVDTFGDKTDSGYIRNRGYIKGVFSNSATTNSLLNAYFIISNKQRVAIKLLEYGSSVVKAYKNNYYNVAVKDGEGKTHSFTGVMYKTDDRLYLNPVGKKKVSVMHNILIKGGEVTLVITEQDYGLTTYKVTFNSDGYKNVMNSLSN